MTITRRKQAGWETGSEQEWDSYYGVLDSWVGVSTVEKYTGSYAARCIITELGGFNFNITATNQARAGFWFYSTSAYSGVDIFRFRSAADADIFEIRHNNSTGVITLYVNSTLRDTSSVGVLPLTTWNHIGMDAKVNDTTGWCTVYVDGVEQLSWSGNTGTTQVTKATFGNSIDPGTGSRWVYYDDIYIDDTTGETSAAVVPLKRFYWTYPNGAGNYTQWDPSTGNNYECVDERPPSDSDYVDTAVTDELDSYAMTTITLGAGQQVDAVIPIARVLREGSTEQVALGTRYSSTDLVGSDQTPGASYNYMWERQTTKPGGGDWDQTAINGFEAIIKSRGTY